MSSKSKRKSCYQWWHQNKSMLVHDSGCLPFGEKIRKFRFEVKWKGKFPEIPFGNCGVPSEVLLFFRSERNGRNFLTVCQTFQFPVSHQPKTITGNRSPNGKRYFVRLVSWFWKNPYHYSTLVPTGLFWQMVSTQCLLDKESWSCNLCNNYLAFQNDETCK